MFFVSFSEGLSICKHPRGQHKVDRQNRQGGRNHRTRAGAQNAFRSRHAVEALMYGNQSYRHAERGRFNQTVDYIVMDRDVVLHLRPENAAVQAQPGYTDQIRAENARHVENRSQKRHGKHARPKARRNHAGDRVYRHHVHRFELFGRFHQTDFAGHCTARAAGKQNRRQHGTQFAQQRSRDHIAQNIGGFEFRQLRIALQTQDHADKQPRNGNNQHRQHAGEIHLAHAQARTDESRTGLRQNVQQKQRNTAEGLNKAEGFRPDGTDKIHKFLYVKFNCFRRHQLIYPNRS